MWDKIIPQQSDSFAVCAVGTGAFYPLALWSRRLWIDTY